MDKQILDLMNHQAQPLPQEEECSTLHINGDTPTTKEEILASYDFQSTRTVGSSPPRTNGDTGAATAGGSGSTWGSLGSRTASSNLKVRQCFYYRSLFLVCAIVLSFLGSFEQVVELGLIITTYRVGIGQGVEKQCNFYFCDVPA